MKLEEYNKKQARCIIDYYKHNPSNRELMFWIKHYGPIYRHIIDEWIEKLKEIEKELYKTNKEV